MAEPIKLGVETYEATVVVRLQAKDGEITEIETKVNPYYALYTVGIFRPPVDSFMPIEL